MASTKADDFENDWTLVDKDGQIDIEPRKNSVSYSKSPSSRDDALVSTLDSPAKDDSEGEAEFEVLSGFQCDPPLETESIQAAFKTTKGENDLPHHLESDTEDEFVAVHQSSCQCAADDGIMIISNHFCLDQDVSPPGDMTAENLSPSKCDQQNQQSLVSSTLSSDSAADGWRELPQLSESGSFLFSSDPNSSEEDNAIEPIPEEEEEGQDFVDLSHETDPLNEMVESTCSVFSFDSDLFSPSDVDEDVANEEECSDITEVSEVSDEDKERDQDQEKVEEADDHLMAESSDDASAFHVDIPTLFVVLGVTTALGFSIGYGLSVYVSNQALEVPGSIKRPGPKTASLPLTSDPMEPLNEVSRDFLDQLALWKLEDRLETPQDQEPETELEDLFDTKALHEKLQLKHFKLMGWHESVKQRLRTAKVMSWYWRLKYEEERLSKEGSEWSKALQEQLHDMEKLYQQEKQIADLWRRMNKNTKLRRVVAVGTKFDIHWRDFLHRWKKGEEGIPGVNYSQKVRDSTELYETLAKEELAEIHAAQDPEVNKPESKSEHISDSIWLNFKNRWTKDSQMKGRMEESSSKSEKCASVDPKERKDLTLFSGKSYVAILPPLLPMGFLDKTVEKRLEDSVALARNPERRAAKKSQSFAEDSGESDSKKNSEEIFKTKSADFKEGVPFENPLFPNGVFSPRSRLRRIFVKTDAKTNLKRDGKIKVYPLTLQIFRELTHRHYASENTKGVCQRIRSYKELALRKCAEETVVQRYGPERRSKPFKKQETAFDGNQTSIHSQGQFLTKEKQKLRKLSQLRGEEIRKQRIQRREWKKKQREVESRRKVAKRLLSELRREKLRIQEEKRKLRRSWKKLKREKKRIYLERERHKKDTEKLKNFMATLREEKKKLKREKAQLNERVNELLSKERENLKVREKALDAQKKKEVERLRNEISKEKNKLRQQREELKSLQKAAKKKYRKWLKELRKIKRQDQEKREAKQAKMKEKERKKRESAERQMRRKREYDSVVREQAKYDKEKRNRKGEHGSHIVKRREWKKTDNNLKEDESVVHQRDSEKIAKQNDPRESFRQQLENVKKWLSDVHKATIERQQIYWSGTLIRPILNAISGRADNSEPYEEKPSDMEDKEVQRHDTYSAGGKENKQTSDRGDTTGRSEWENRRVEMRKIMSKMEKRGCELKENEKREMAVSKSEVAKISEDKALMGFTNLTFGVDLVRILLKGIDKQNRRHKMASDSDGEAESTAFIIVSKESDDHDSSVGLNVERKKSGRKRQRPDRNPKRPGDRLWGHQKWPDKNFDAAKQHRESPQGPTTSEDSRLASEDLYEHPTTAHNVRYKLSSEGPTPPNDIGLSLKERYKKRFKAPKNQRKPVTPQGPILSDDVYQGRSSKGKKRKRRQRSEVQDKVCSSDNPGKRESIPPPDWVFERAKGRTHQRSVPWYVRRAEDREFQRSVDKHDSQFPCGRKRKRYKGPLDPSWLFDRADNREFQRLNNVPWYTRRAEGRETERQKGQDSGFLERGFYRRYLRDLSSWYGDQTWMPQGPSMEEHR